MSNKLDLILDKARDHAKQIIVPNIDIWNNEKRWPREASDRAGDLGLAGLYAPEEWGGQGLPLSEGIHRFMNNLV